MGPIDVVRLFSEPLPAHAADAPAQNENRAGDSLTELERRILREHDELAAYAPGPRERRIRERYEINPTRYYQILNKLLDNVDALKYAPVTVNRLRARRAANRKRHW